MQPRILTIQCEIEFELEEAQLVALCIFELSNDQIKDYMGWSLDEVKKKKAALAERMGIHPSKTQCYGSQLRGFDLFGCLKGEPLFTRREKGKLLKIAPWVCIYRTID